MATGTFNQNSLRKKILEPLIKTSSIISDRLEDIWSFVLDAFKICDCDKFLSTTPVMQFLL